MRFPPEVLSEHFDRQLHRGRFIRYKATDELNDPGREERFKFALVLSIDCSDETILLAFTTSRTDFFDRNIQFQYLLLRWEPGSYEWMSQTTILNLKQILAVSRTKLRGHIIAGDLTFEGVIRSEDQDRVDTILLRSPLVSPKVLARIVPEERRR